MGFYMELNEGYARMLYSTNKKKQGDTRLKSPTAPEAKNHISSNTTPKS